MRIVDRQTFLEQPAGTLFAKYAPCIFDELLIKGDSLPNDFGYQEIVSAIKCHDSGDFADQLFLAETEGASLTMDFNCQGRDGCFDKDQLFAIFEKADVGQLIARLQEALL